MSDVFQIGGFELKSFTDGILKTSTDFVLGMDKAQANALTGAGEDGSVYIPINNFLFQKDGATVLIDAGAGDTMQATMGKLPANLRAAGHALESITHIVITHIHPDHANGLVDATGAALFPNAEILVHAEEFDFWMADNDGSESDKIKAQRARNRINLKPYMDRVRRMRDGEVMVGCTPMMAPGHSPGHTCWRIGTGKNAFVAWGDLVHFSDIQIAHPDSAVKYDLDPDLARRSRLRMLDMVANEGLAVAGAHVAAPGLGYLTRKGTGYAYNPA
jgi:glyoxylase-like metal-dependent hydrolase (beta-lactamase superfamily II)